VPHVVVAVTPDDQVVLRSNVPSEELASFGELNDMLGNISGNTLGKSVLGSFPEQQLAGSFDT
jgi:hypothetical protein